MSDSGLEAVGTPTLDMRSMDCDPAQVWTLAHITWSMYGSAQTISRLMDMLIFKLAMTMPRFTRGEFLMITTIRLCKARGNPGLFQRLTIATMGLLLIAGCASVAQPPMAELQAAELAIADAERSSVADYAPVELSEARDKLRAAHSAVQQEKMVQAKRLAEESRVDAELASARAEAAQAKVVNDEMRKSIDTLKHEMQRNTGENQ
jgi:hypothetical protein